METLPYTMPVQPILMSDIARSRPRDPPSPVDDHRSRVGQGNYNRFSSLFPRSRTPSTKRARSPEVIVEQVKLPKLDSETLFNQLKDHDKCMDLAKTALAGAATAIGAACRPDDNGIGTALSGVHAALEQLVLGSEAIKSVMMDWCKTQDGIQTKVRQATAGNLQVPAGEKNPRKSVSKGPTEVKTQMVKDTLREAERRMVVFDLDLGTAPTINKATISRKVTLALHAKAASGEHDWNTKDAGEMVDDVLSCAQLEFLGSGTRKFHNNRNKDDPRNNKICTVPVRFDFKNKETRLQAEQTMRKICKVKPSVPYPRRLRAMINDTIKKGKSIHQNCFIQTKVDIENLTLKALVRSEGKWTEIKDITQAIPLDILDRTAVSDMEADNEVFTQVVASEGSQASL